MNNIEIKNGSAHYECGCKFEVIDFGPPVRLAWDARLEHLPLTCKRTWDLIGGGNTKGVFQLETRFGQQYAKRLKPENIEQLAALGAILRPGCIQVQRDGKNVAEHYMDRKNGLEEVTYFHESLKAILGPTFGEMIYQEQAMKIATDIAGFDLQQADVLRKAIGKKKADIMAQVKVEFLIGCAKMGIVNAEQAEELFGWIEKSQRYSFNKSHAVSYAMNGYLSAYAKAHFPVSFFTSYLWYAKDKQKKFDEIKLLVANSRVMGINICPPDFRHTNEHFKRIHAQLCSNDVYNPYDDKVYFGFADIKGIGDSAINKLKSAIYTVETAVGKERKDWTWIEFLIYFSQEVSSTVITGMIEAGALSYFDISRTQMLFDYEQYSKLTVKERAWIKQRIPKSDSLSDLLQKALHPHNFPTKGAKGPDKGPCANKNRVQKIKDTLQLVNNPPYSMKDSSDWIARIEEARLGISITASVLDSCKNSDQVNCTILEFQKRKEKNSGIFIACQIDEIKTHIVRNSEKEMAFITVSDGEATMDCVIFANVWENDIRSKGLCVVENTVTVSGERSRDRDSFIVKNLWQLT